MGNFKLFGHSNKNKSEQKEEISANTFLNIRTVQDGKIYTIDNKILGKPKDRLDAINMLSTLSNRVHQVYTGVTLYYYVNGRVFIETFADCANVHFRNLSLQTINDYVDSWEPMDKAGAYGIQGLGAILVDKIDGDFYTIVGLPISKVYHSIKSNQNK